MLLIESAHKELRDIANQLNITDTDMDTDTDTKE